MGSYHGGHNLFWGGQLEGLLLRRPEPGGCTQLENGEAREAGLRERALEESLMGAGLP